MSSGLVVLHSLLHPAGEFLGGSCQLWWDNKSFQDFLWNKAPVDLDLSLGSLFLFRDTFMFLCSFVPVLEWVQARDVYAPCVTTRQCIFLTYCRVKCSLCQAVLKQNGYSYSRFIRFLTWIPNLQGYLGNSSSQIIRHEAIYLNLPSVSFFRLCKHYVNAALVNVFLN